MLGEYNLSVSSCFVSLSFISHSLLPCLTVLSEWMSLSQPCDALFERYKPIPSHGPDFSSLVSRAVKALQLDGHCHRSTPGLAPGPWHSSLISTAPSQGPLLPSSIFTTRQDKVRLLILTMKEKPNWLFLSSSSSLQLVYNEPRGSF